MLKFLREQFRARKEQSTLRQKAKVGKTIQGDEGDAFARSVLSNDKHRAIARKDRTTTTRHHARPIDPDELAALPRRGDEPAAVAVLDEQPQPRDRWPDGRANWPPPTTPTAA